MQKNKQIVIFVRSKRNDYQCMKQDMKEPSAEYSYTYKYSHSAVTADCVVFAINGTELEQFHAFTDVNRDPRERVISIAFWAVTRIAEVRGSDDASQAQ